MTSELKIYTPKILLLCGPKGCGKNKLLSHYMDKHSLWFDMYDASCKVHLYKLVQDFFLVSEDRFWEIYNDRELKERPMPEFRVMLTYPERMDLEALVGPLMGKPSNDISRQLCFNLSVRQTMIYLSEVVIKPRLGMNYFSRSRMALIKEPKSLPYIYYDDSSSCFNGDSSELDGLVEHFGEDNILLIRIKGRGTFDGDSRSYHPDGVVKNTVDLWNDKDEQSFLEAGSKIIEEFLNRS